MASLADPRRRTADAIHARYERDAEDWRRPHLGASSIGRPCSRELWYRFRWAIAPHFEGRILRLFERGRREEEWLLEELAAIGVQVQAKDPATGEQWQVWLHDGHFGGSCDGKLLGVLEAPKTEHLFESKTANDKRFRELQRHGVQKAEPEHYAQMQSYMHGLKLKRALYLCVNKNDDTIYQERITYDRKVAEACIAKAEAVIRSTAPLGKISEDPTWYECKLCDARPICHLEQVERLERNCRTCASSTPVRDGAWRCEHHQESIGIDRQREGCPDHLFIPHLLPWPAIDADERARSVTYRRHDGILVTDVHRELVVGVEEDRK